MKAIDASKKHPVTLTFLLDEEVTLQLFAQKLALACGGSALRLGEAILVEHAKIACVVTKDTVESRIGLAGSLLGASFGYQWRSTQKAAKRVKLTRNRCR